MKQQNPKKKVLVVIGAGPAGLGAAITAANAGLDVTLIDSQTLAGGQYFKQLPPSFQRLKAGDQQEKFETLTALLNHPRITRQQQTQVLGIYENGRVLWLKGPDGPAEIEAAAVIIATGAYDRPAAFPGWTLPGVMSVGAAQALIKSQRVLPGKKVLLAGTGPLLLAVAAALIWGGAEVAGVLESSTAMRRLPLGQLPALWGQGERVREGSRYLSTILRAGVPYRVGWAVVEALGKPEERVQGALIAPLDEQWQPRLNEAQKVECDTICIGYGLIPETALTHLAGAEHTYLPEVGGWVPTRDTFLQTTLPAVFAIGDGAGIGGAVQAQLEGQIAALTAASLLNGLTSSDFISQSQPLLNKLDKQRGFQRLYGKLFTPDPGIHAWAQADTILCRCEGVDRAAVETAVQLGAQTVTEVKGITRAGMGACQGRLCRHLIAGQIARITGKSIASCGQLSPRAPIHPLPIADVLERGAVS